MGRKLSERPGPEIQAPVKKVDRVPALFTDLPGVLTIVDKRE